MNVRFDEQALQADVDLAAVPPHLRDEVRRRISVIEAHLRGERTAAASAALLGLASGSYRRLARAWRARSSPATLIAGGTARPKKGRLHEEQVAVLASAIEELPEAIVERVLERARAIGLERGVTMPSRGAMASQAVRMLAGTLPADNPAAGTDIVVEHTVVDLPVEAPGEDGGYMPIATLVVPTDRPRVAGLALHRERPTAAGTARALLDALPSSLPGGAAPLAPVVYIGTLSAPEWNELRRALTAGGCLVAGPASAETPPPRALPRLLGGSIGRVGLKPRAGRRPFLGRPAKLWADRPPMSLDDAAAFLRASWIALPAEGHPGLDPDRWSGLLRELRAIADEGQ